MASPAKGIAPQDAKTSQEQSPEDAVKPDGPVGVGAAGGRKTAMPSQKRGKESLVSPDGGQQGFLDHSRWRR